jgi:glycosyltransferase involved in cell wall biosynthesis
LPTAESDGRRDLIVSVNTHQPWLERGSAPVVSVIVPAYNAQETLAETLESALAQTEQPVEVICVDDGSTDATLGVASRFADRMRVLTGPNSGVSAARNRGFAESSGEWIVFLDADDLLCPATLRTRLLLAEASECDVIVCNWREIVKDRSNPGAEKAVDMKLIEADAELAFASTVWATTAALMFKRSVVEKVGGFREDLPVIQDARFALDAARASARFGHSNHIGALYRIVEGSLSRRNPTNFYRDILQNTLQIEEDWRVRGVLTPSRQKVIADSLNVAGRGLFRAGSQLYFEALAAQRRVSGTIPSHSRIAGPLARVIGLERARRFLAMFHKN